MSEHIITFNTVNDAIVRRFQALVSRDRLAHAYLFCGPRMLGKTSTARTVADIVVCQEDPASCRDCPPCSRRREHHPDIVVLECPYGETIKIDSVRDLLARSHLRPFQGRRKVFIIQNCDQMTQEASNCLLKTLEEPSQDNLLILTTSNLENNLATIVSRCQVIHFEPMAPDKLRDLLTGRHGVQPLEAHFLSRFSEGCPGSALKMYEDRFFDWKNSVLDRFLGHSMEDKELKALAADKERMRAFLECLLGWFRDCLLVKVDVHDERLFHLDREEDLEMFARKYSFENLHLIYDEIVRATRLLSENLNVKLSLTMIQSMIRL